jgi:hypothetical protein
VLAATACTPPDDSRVAVTYIGDGQIEILAYVCEGYQVVDVALSKIREKSMVETWDVGPPIHDSSYAEHDYVIEITPFDVPEGWEVFTGPVEDLELESTYLLSFATVEGQVSTISFRIRDLEQLGDRVLTGRSGRERAMTTSDFLARAERDCRR